MRKNKRDRLLDSMFPSLHQFPYSISKAIDCVDNKVRAFQTQHCYHNFVMSVLHVYSIIPFKQDRVTAKVKGHHTDRVGVSQNIQQFGHQRSHA